jgi:hypothetical protein
MSVCFGPYAATLCAQGNAELGGLYRCRCNGSPQLGGDLPKGYFPGHGFELGNAWVDVRRRR